MEVDVCMRMATFLSLQKGTNEVVADELNLCSVSMLSIIQNSIDMKIQLTYIWFRMFLAAFVSYLLDRLTTQPQFIHRSLELYWPSIFL